MVDAFSYLLDPLTLNSLHIMIDNRLSLWNFVSTDPSCKGTLLIYKFFKGTVNLGNVSERSVLKYVRENRPEFYSILKGGKGKAWLLVQIKECINGLKKI